VSSNLLLTTNWLKWSPFKKGEPKNS
jgi:hypothetical protein